MSGAKMWRLVRTLLLVLVLLVPLAAAAEPSAYSFTGLLSYGAAACAPVAGCAALETPQEQLFDLGEHHGARHVQATLQWVRSTPLADELRLGVSYDDASGARVHTFAQGGSPLALDVVVPVDGALLVWANFPQTVEPVPVWASARQVFTIEGSLS